MDIIKLNELIYNKNILILGFGKEGKTSYQFLRKHFPNQLFTIADRDLQLLENNNFLKNENISVKLGDDYLNDLVDFDLIIKTPGISLKDFDIKLLNQLNITSQTNLFLQLFSKQVIGITGTKGKSTTTTLIYHIIKSFTENVVLVGNIGIPPFEQVINVNNETIIVYEMSSHQLENISVSPHISILLNLFQEHLDHYQSYKDYQLAKFNIAKYQKNNDYFIYNADNEEITIIKNENSFDGIKIPFSLETETKSGAFLKDEIIYFIENKESKPFYSIKTNRYLKGKHNLLNIMAAIIACKLTNIPDETILKGIANFKGLEHRIEYVGNYNEIDFYNDSISTIPEASIAAIKALENVDTLILGGFDRGIDYKHFALFLIESDITNLIFIGNAGKRIFEEIKNFGCFGKAFYEPTTYEEIVEICFSVTAKGKTCLLSPAAASYDMFYNFEERGNFFKNLIINKF